MQWQFVCFWCSSPQWARVSSFTRFLDHTQRHTTVGRTPLNEWSAHRRDLYLTTHNTYNRQTSMPPPIGTRTHNLSRRAPADLRLIPRGHWDWQCNDSIIQKFLPNWIIGFLKAFFLEHLKKYHWSVTAKSTHTIVHNLACVWRIILSAIVFVL